MALYLGQLFKIPLGLAYYFMEIYHSCADTSLEAFTFPNNIPSC